MGNGDQLIGVLIYLAAMKRKSVLLTQTLFVLKMVGQKTL
jgi:hypothetical protein